MLILKHEAFSLLKTIIMKNLFLFIILLSLLNSCHSKKNTVTIRWNVKMNQPINKEQSIFIVGNQEFLGFWNPAKIKMNKIDETTWSFIQEVESEKLIEYKFTLGNWEQQAADKDGNEMDNEEFIVPKRDSTINIQIDRWTTNSEKKITGQITGEVEYIKQFHYDGLIDRDIIIWLPPSYHHNKKKRYPVLYMHDGQNIIDPNTSSFGVDWQVDESVDSLIKKNVIKEIM